MGDDRLDLPVADDLSEYVQVLGARSAGSESDFEQGVEAFLERLEQTEASADTIDFVRSRVDIRADQTGDAPVATAARIVTEAAARLRRG
jgi:hypothetical protein